MYRVLPSDVARLFLAYLQEKKYVDTMQKFIEECPHLQELRGNEGCPVLVPLAKDIETILEEHAWLTEAAKKEQPEYPDRMWQRLDGMISQLKYKCMKPVSPPDEPRRNAHDQTVRSKHVVNQLLVEYGQQRRRARLKKKRAAKRQQQQPPPVATLQTMTPDPSPDDPPEYTSEEPPDLSPAQSTPPSEVIGIPSTSTSADSLPPRLQDAPTTLGTTPRRKRIPPKKKSGSSVDGGFWPSPCSESRINPEELAEFPEILEILMSDKDLTERLAGTITKALPHMEAKSSGTQSGSAAIPLEVDQRTVEEAIDMTSSDPAFDSLFSLFNVDREKFLEDERRYSLKKPNSSGVGESGQKSQDPDVCPGVVIRNLFPTGDLGDEAATNEERSEGDAEATDMPELNIDEKQRHSDTEPTSDRVGGGGQKSRGPDMSHGVVSRNLFPTDKDGREDVTSKGRTQPDIVTIGMPISEEQRRPAKALKMSGIMAGSQRSTCPYLGPGVVIRNLFPTHGEGGEAATSRGRTQGSTGTDVRPELSFDDAGVDDRSIDDDDHGDSLCVVDDAGAGLERNLPSASSQPGGKITEALVDETSQDSVWSLSQGSQGSTPSKSAEKKTKSGKRRNWSKVMTGTRRSQRLTSKTVQNATFQESAGADHVHLEAANSLLQQEQSLLNPRSPASTLGSPMPPDLGSPAPPNLGSPAPPNLGSPVPPKLGITAPTLGSPATNVRSSPVPESLTPSSKSPVPPGPQEKARRDFECSRQLLAIAKCAKENNLPTEYSKRLMASLSSTEGLSPVGMNVSVTTASPEPVRSKSVPPSNTSAHIDGGSQFTVTTTNTRPTVSQTGPNPQVATSSIQQTRPQDKGTPSHGAVSTTPKKKSSHNRKPRTKTSAGTARRSRQPIILLTRSGATVTQQRFVPIAPKGTTAASQPPPLPTVGYSPLMIQDSSPHLLQNQSSSQVVVLQAVDGLLSLGGVQPAPNLQQNWVPQQGSAHQGASIPVIIAPPPEETRSAVGQQYATSIPALSVNSQGAQSTVTSLVSQPVRPSVQPHGGPQTTVVSWSSNGVPTLDPQQSQSSHVTSCSQSEQGPPTLMSESERERSGPATGIDGGIPGPAGGMGEHSPDPAGRVAESREHNQLNLDNLAVATLLEDDLERSLQDVSTQDIEFIIKAITKTPQKERPVLTQNSPLAQAIAKKYNLFSTSAEGEVLQNRGEGTSGPDASHPQGSDLSKESRCVRKMSFEGTIAEKRLSAPSYSAPGGNHGGDADMPQDNGATSSKNVKKPRSKGKKKKPKYIIDSEKQKKLEKRMRTCMKPGGQDVAKIDSNEGGKRSVKQTSAGPEASVEIDQSGGLNGSKETVEGHSPGQSEGEDASDELVEAVAELEHSFHSTGEPDISEDDTLQDGHTGISDKVGTDPAEQVDEANLGVSCGNQQDVAGTHQGNTEEPDFCPDGGDTVPVSTDNENGSLSNMACGEESTVNNVPSAASKPRANDGKGQNDVENEAVSGEIGRRKQLGMGGESLLGTGKDVECQMRGAQADPASDQPTEVQDEMVTRRALDSVDAQNETLREENANSRNAEDKRKERSMDSSAGDSPNQEMEEKAEAESGSDLTQPSSSGDHMEERHGDHQTEENVAGNISRNDGHREARGSGDKEPVVNDQEERTEIRECRVVLHRSSEDDLNMKNVGSHHDDDESGLVTENQSSGTQGEDQSVGDGLTPGKNLHSREDNETPKHSNQKNSISGDNLAQDDSRLDRTTDKDHHPKESKLDKECQKQRSKSTNSDHGTRGDSNSDKNIVTEGSEMDGHGAATTPTRQKHGDRINSPEGGKKICESLPPSLKEVRQSPRLKQKRSQSSALRDQRAADHGDVEGEKSVHGKKRKRQEEGSSAQKVSRVESRSKRRLDGDSPVPDVRSYGGASRERNTGEAFARQILRKNPLEVGSDETREEQDRGTPLTEEVSMGNLRTNEPMEVCKPTSGESSSGRRREQEEALSSVHQPSGRIPEVPHESKSSYEEGMKEKKWRKLSSQKFSRQRCNKAASKELNPPEVSSHNGERSEENERRDPSADNIIRESLKGARTGDDHTGSVLDPTVGNKQKQNSLGEKGVTGEERSSEQGETRLTDGEVLRESPESTRPLVDNDLYGSVIDLTVGDHQDRDAPDGEHNSTRTAREERIGEQREGVSRDGEASSQRDATSPGEGTGNREGRTSSAGVVLGESTSTVGENDPSGSVKELSVEDNREQNVPAGGNNSAETTQGERAEELKETTVPAAEVPRESSPDIRTPGEHGPSECVLDLTSDGQQELSALTAGHNSAAQEEGTVEGGRILSTEAVVLLEGPESTRALEENDPSESWITLTTEGHRSAGRAHKESNIQIGQQGPVGGSPGLMKAPPPVSPEGELKTTERNPSSVPDSGGRPEDSDVVARRERNSNNNGEDSVGDVEPFDACSRLSYVDFERRPLWGAKHFEYLMGHACQGPEADGALEGRIHKSHRSSKKVCWYQHVGTSLIPLHRMEKIAKRKSSSVATQQLDTDENSQNSLIGSSGKACSSRSRKSEVQHSTSEVGKVVPSPNRMITGQNSAQMFADVHSRLSLGSEDTSLEPPMDTGDGSRGAESKQPFRGPSPTKVHHSSKDGSTASMENLQSHGRTDSKYVSETEHGGHAHSEDQQICGREHSPKNSLETNVDVSVPVQGNPGSNAPKESSTRRSLSKICDNLLSKKESERHSADTHSHHSEHCSPRDCSGEAAKDKHGKPATFEGHSKFGASSEGTAENSKGGRHQTARSHSAKQRNISPGEGKGDSSRHGVQGEHSDSSSPPLNNSVEKHHRYGSGGSVIVNDQQPPSVMNGHNGGEQLSSSSRDEGSERNPSGFEKLGEKTIHSAGGPCKEAQKGEDQKGEDRSHRLVKPADNSSNENGHVRDEVYPEVVDCTQDTVDRGGGNEQELSRMESQKNSVLNGHGSPDLSHGSERCAIDGRRSPTSGSVQGKALDWTAQSHQNGASKGHGTDDPSHDSGAGHGRVSAPRSQQRLGQDSVMQSQGEMAPSSSQKIKKRKRRRSGSSQQEKRRRPKTVTSGIDLGSIDLDAFLSKLHGSKN